MENGRIKEVVAQVVQLNTVVPKVMTSDPGGLQKPHYGTYYISKKMIISFCKEEMCSVWIKYDPKQLRKTTT